MREDSFISMLNDQVGTIYKDAVENGVRYLIMRGPYNLCAYVGVPGARCRTVFIYSNKAVKSEDTQPSRRR